MKPSSVPRAFSEELSLPMQIHMIDELREMLNDVDQTGRDRLVKL
ncbi:hypothetical protein [Ruegeria arenilitoris]|nr:hypothetical protein [Ruegeria arenilitoris]